MNISTATIEFMNKSVIACLLFFVTVFIAPIKAAEESNAASGKLQPVTVQLNWNHQFEFAGFYAALKQGYYQQAGMDVTLKAWSPGVDAITDVVTGQAQFATGYTSFIANYAKGDPISLVMASFQFSPMVLLSHEPVLSLSQLSGKKIMHYGNMQIKALISKAESQVDKPIISVQSSGNLQDFIDKKTDYYAAYNTNEPYRLRKEGVPFYTLDPKSYGIQSYGDLVITSQEMVRAKPDLVAAFREATIKGWQYAIDNPVATVDFIIENYTVVKSREALLAEAEATKVYVQPGDASIGDVDPAKLMASAVDAKQTGLMTEQQFANLNIQDFLFQPTSLKFSEQELQYIKDNPVIQIGNDSAWEPFEFIDENGDFKGMSADYFALISKKTGIQFTHFKNKPWPEVLQLMQSKELPIISASVITADRRQYMDFTQPYLSFPLVLVAGEEVDYIGDYQQLAGKTLAVPKGYWSQEWVQRHYPNIDLLLVDNVKQGLQAVVAGKADAFSGNLASINYAIKRHGLNGLRIVGDANHNVELAIGVSYAEPVLFSILEKTLKSITEEEKDAIYNNWIKLELLEKTDYTNLIITISIFVVVATFLLLIIMVMQRQKNSQAYYINQVNELSMASYTNFATHEIEWVSDSLLRFLRCRRENLVGQPHDVLRHPGLTQEVYDQLLATIAKGEVWKGELKGINCDKHEYWVEATVTPKFENGVVIGAWTTRIDITDKKRLEQMAMKDSLTGVHNRNHFNEYLELQVKQASRQKKPFALAMFDIDHFKMVNDRFGHQRGDKVIQNIIQVTKQFFGRGSDLIFRMGGEEFVIIAHFENPLEFESYLNEFRRAVEALEISNPESDTKVVTISIGGYFIQKVGTVSNPSLYYSIIDKKLYEAKNKGRNRVEVLVD